MKINRRLQRILALCLAFLMTFSSVGFAVDMHFCRGELKSFSFFGKAESCHEKVEPRVSCPHHQQMMDQQNGPSCTAEEKDCCDSKTVLIQYDQDQLIPAAQEIQMVQLPWIGQAPILLLPSLALDVIPSSRYKPPLIQRDIPVLIQSYLL